MRQVILRCRELFADAYQIGCAQAASEVEARVSGIYPRYSPLVTPMEMPGGQDEAQLRASFEEHSAVLRAQSSTERRLGSRLSCAVGKLQLR
jgi:hypothetical protein